MPDNDSNIIKPVEGLQNIAALTPAKRREQRKRRQSLNKKKEHQYEQEPDEPDESVDRNELTSELNENDSDRSTIDYCA